MTVRPHVSRALREYIKAELEIRQRRIAMIEMRLERSAIRRDTTEEGQSFFNQCEAIRKRNKRRCRSTARPGSKYCARHAELEVSG